jgi:hypothetical protein
MLPIVVNSAPNTHEEDLRKALEGCGPYWKVQAITTCSVVYKRETDGAQIVGITTVIVLGQEKCPQVGDPK